MNEIATPLAQLEIKINILKGQTAQNIIEIGSCLIQAKEQLQHGEWGKWLEEKVEFSQNSAIRFMRVAREFSNSPTLVNLPPSKVFALLDVPAEERESFIESTPIDGMTTRQLQQAIKEKKQAEERIRELENKPPQIIEKEVIPKDYEQMRKKFNDLNYQVQAKQIQIDKLEKEKELNKQNADRYINLKSQIETLTKEKNDIGRQIQAATELSGLVVEAREFFNKKLAPIKYSKAITEASKDEIVRRNLTDIINIFQGWINEMDKYIGHQYIEAEVINE